MSDKYRAVPIRALFASTGYSNLCASNSVPLTHSYRKKVAHDKAIVLGGRPARNARGKRDVSRKRKRGGNSERGEFGQVGRLDEITGKEYTCPRQEILTEILNLRTLHPLCRFSQPQGTHSDGYLAKAE